MSYEDPTPEEEPTSRLAGRMPWILLGIGALAILAVLGVIISMRRGDQVNVNVAGQPTSTPAVVGVPVTVVVTATQPPATAITPPTLVVPTPTPIVVTAVPKQPPTAVVLAPPGAPPAGSTGQTGGEVSATVVPPPTQAPPPPPPTPAPPPTAQPFR